MVFALPTGVVLSSSEMGLVGLPLLIFGLDLGLLGKALPNHNNTVML